MTRAIALALWTAATAAIAACATSTEPARCVTARDCPSGQTCVASTCRIAMADASGDVVIPSDGLPDDTPTSDAFDTFDDADAARPDASCTTTTCGAPGSACVDGACVADCRYASAQACGAATVCDYTDGQCRTPGPCVLRSAFTRCGMSMCGPGLECSAFGTCVSLTACDRVVCDTDNRCWGANCPCARPAPRCATATLAQLNRAEFAGARPINMNPGEGIMDLEFDDVCTAYAVTVISGTDQLRQMAADGVLTTWNSVSNLDMGEVAVLRYPNNTTGTTIGEVAATYICIGGCTPTGMDGQMGVIRLDRTSMARPLPNVVPAMVTTGTGPFANAVVDAGPYGLTWGRDRTLYIGNLDTNGEFSRVDLATGMRALVNRYVARVHAATVYDATRLLVAVAGGEVFLQPTAGGTPTRWATLPGDVTSMARDVFTGRVYAEVRTTPPRIVWVTPDGAAITTFQTPPRLGRIAIAPDNFLYHACTYPNVNWNDASSPPIVRWPLPPTR